MASPLRAEPPRTAITTWNGSQESLEKEAGTSSIPVSVENFPAAKACPPECREHGFWRPYPVSAVAPRCCAVGGSVVQEEDRRHPRADGAVRDSSACQRRRAPYRRETRSPPAAPPRGRHLCRASQNGCETPGIRHARPKQIQNGCPFRFSWKPVRWLSKAVSKGICNYPIGPCWGTKRKRTNRAGRTMRRER